MTEGGAYGEILNPNLVQWNTSTDLPPERVIEILTVPSNPLGDYYAPNYPTAPNKIYDAVYYWPHLTGNMSAPFNESIMFFSLTKLSGHAATRFGWAIVKNATLASQISNFISRNNMGPSVDIKWRALNIIKAVAGTNYLDTVGNMMKERWTRINAWFASQSRFQLLSTPNTAYIYALCLRPEDANCTTVFTGIGIDGYPGTRFGDTRSVYRINLTLHSYAFNLLMQKLYRLTTAPELLAKQDYSQLPPAPILPEHIVSEYMDSMTSI